MRYEEDRRRLDVLTDLFFHTVKPSELFQLTMTINAMCNLGDFIHSIRLMSAARTTVAPAGAGKLALVPRANLAGVPDGLCRGWEASRVPA